MFKGHQRAELWRVRQEINFSRISVLRTCKSIITDFRLSWRFIVDVDSAFGLGTAWVWAALPKFPRHQTCNVPLRNVDNSATATRCKD
jgi:hypothetical protein